MYIQLAQFCNTLDLALKNRPKISGQALLQLLEMALKIV